MNQKSQKFESTGYNISIVGKNLKVTPALHNYIFDKLAKMDRLTDHILDVFITLEKQKVTCKVSIMLKFFHFQIKVSGETEEMYSAIDRASNKLFQLIRRYKKRLQDHHKKDHSMVEMNVEILERGEDFLEEINDDIEEENQRKEAEKYSFHKIIANERMNLKTLTQDEAIMKMELSEEPFLIFRGEEDRKIKVIYRREDHNFGLVAVE